MAKTENSNFGVFALILINLYMQSLGYEFVVLNPLTALIKVIFNQTYQSRYNETLPESTWIKLLSVTTSAVTIGTIAGALMTGRLMIYFSRKCLLSTCHIVSLLSILVVGLIGKLTGSYEIFIAGRILAGIPMGMAYIVVPVIIGEVCARNRQGFWQCISGSSILFGVLMGVVCAHPQIFGTYELWPIAIAIGAIPSLIYFPLSCMIPNTPFYLIRQGRQDEAMAALKKMRHGQKAELEEEYDEMKEEMKGSKVLGLMEILKTKQYRLQFIAVLCLFANIQLCGTPNIILYSDRVFRQAGLSTDTAANATVGVFALQFVVSMTGPKLVDRFGGKRVLMSASALEILAWTLFTISQALLHLAPDELPYLSIVAVALFSIPFAYGTNLATTAIAVAITIEPTRATVMGSVIPVFWILGWFAGFIPPYLKIALGAYSFCLWLGCASIFLIYFYFFLPETKGKTINEIQAKFSLKRSASSMPLSERKSTQDVLNPQA